MPGYAYPLLIAAGFVAGFVNTLAGSGSLVTLPALIFLGLPPTVANGTNRLAILMQNVVAVSRFRDFGVLEIRKSGWLALPAVFGAIVGARLAVDLDEEILRRTIGALFLLLLPVIAFRPQRWLVGRQSDLPGHGWALWVGLFLVGVYGGFIQAGVGIFLLVCLVLGAGYDLVRANAIKVLIVLCFTVFALAVFIRHDQVSWLPGLTLGIGNMAGAWWATRLATERGARFVRWLLLIVVAVSGVLLVVGWNR
ncbi:MAG: sulfite exporter TauE/SafE family protein [bacterium]|nr:sulfite exporter TauE/SafE family protein [bacterium]